MYCFWFVFPPSRVMADGGFFSLFSFLRNREARKNKYAYGGESVDRVVKSLHASTTSLVVPSSSVLPRARINTWYISMSEKLSIIRQYLTDTNLRTIVRVPTYLNVPTYLPT